jgi:AcrR family transcriptional regulator
MKPKKRRDAGRARGEPIVEAVLMHTLEELATSGLAGLSVERIAQKAEVNKTSVYRRWPTREALVSAAMERMLGEVSARIPDTGSLRGDLLGLLAPVCELIGSDLGKAVLRAAVTEATGSSVKEIASRQIENTSQPLRAVMVRAQARGEWRPGADPQQLVFMLVGAVMHRALLEQAPLSRRWITGLVELALEGVRPRG